MTEPNNVNNRNGKWLTISLAMIQCTVIPLIAWLGKSVVELRETVASLRPVIAQVATTTAVVIDKNTYGRDWDKHDTVHQRINVDMANIQTTIQSIRLDITKLELQLQDKIRERIKSE